MKHNLAKVLGLEEYNEEPNIRVEPTEDEVIQIEQDKFVQEMADHSEATTEALEAIGNAQQLASVIARNDSQDKTAYELLKVAVEQLKEKTGVYTHSVSLESLDKGSYKTEALEDVKKFISKVWEAIKKAFFAMWEKVKSFFKGLFDRNKSIEKEADEIAKDAAELEKEINKAPKTPEQAKNYSSDYFGIKKNYFDENKGAAVPALGYTPGTTNKTTVGGFKTTDKDVEYSDNKYDRMPRETEGDWDSLGGYFSKEVYSYLGNTKTTEKTTLDRRLKEFEKQINAIARELNTHAGTVDYGEVKSNGEVVIPKNTAYDKKLMGGNFATGEFGYSLERKGLKVILEIKKTQELDDGHALQSMAPLSIKEIYVPYIDSLIKSMSRTDEILNKRFETMNDWINDQSKWIENNPEVFEYKKDQIKWLQQHFTEVLSFMQSVVAAQANLSRFVQAFCRAILTAMRQSINSVKANYEHYLKYDGYIKQINQLKRAGWSEG